MDIIGETFFQNIPEIKFLTHCLLIQYEPRRSADQLLLDHTDSDTTSATYVNAPWLKEDRDRQAASSELI